MMSSLDVDCFLKKQLVDIVELIVLFLKTPMLPPTFSQLATMTIQKSHAYIPSRNPCMSNFDVFTIKSWTHAFSWYSLDLHFQSISVDTLSTTRSRRMGTYRVVEDSSVTDFTCHFHQWWYTLWAKLWECEGKVTLKICPQYILYPMQHTIPIAHDLRRLQIIIAMKVLNLS